MEDKVDRTYRCKVSDHTGAFAGFGDSRLAAAVSEAGGLGMITAGALRTPENLSEDIRRAHSITHKPIAVNLSMGMCPMVEEMREVAIEEGIPVVETSAFNASEHGRRLKDAGVIWIHKVATVEHAIAAAKQGADAIVIVGIEGTGFKSIRQLPISIALPLAVKQIDVPVVAAGGIGSGRGLIASLALGAEGVYIGTAFMATKECPIPERHKEFLVKSQPTDPQIRDKTLTPPDPEKVKKVMEKTRIPKEVIENVGRISENMKKHFQEISKIVLTATKNNSLIPKTILDQDTEFKVLKENKLIEERFKGIKINVERAESSTSSKAEKAIPGKPGIEIK